MILVYLGAAGLLDSPRLALVATVWSILPLACIWSPQSINVIAALFESRGLEPTGVPERLVLVLAWIALLAPLWVPALALAIAIRK